MRYEVDMQTGESTRIVFEVGDRLYFKSADEFGDIMKIEDNEYHLLMDDGVFLITGRTALVRDAEVIGGNHVS